MDKSAEQITVSELIANELHNVGVSDIFCVVGGAISHLTDALATDSRFRIHYMLHEQSAGIAAESFSSVNGKPSALLVTSGPGSSNAMTPLVAAWTNSTPLIVIAGQVRFLDVQNAGSNRQWGSQHLDSITMVSRFTKVAERIDPETAQSQVKKVLSKATDGRPGPVWLEVSVDVQRSTSRFIQNSRLDNNSHIASETNTFMQKFLSAIEVSKRPLVLIGNGCRGNSEQVLKFIQSLSWPVQVTWPPLDLMQADDPLYAGRPGSISTWGANLTIQNADLLLVLGARLDWGQVAFKPENFAPKAVKFRVEIDVEELRRIPKENIADACVSVEEFLVWAHDAEVLKKASEANLSSWKNQVSTWKEKFGSLGGESPIEEIGMYEMLEVISENSEQFKTIVSGSSGTCTEQVMQAIKPTIGQRVVNSGGLGSMGFGISGAIGAYFATGMPVLCLESDGSFSMNPQDLNFITKNDLPIRILIMDSQGYKSILLSQRRGGFSHSGVNAESGLDLLDPILVAGSMGMKAQKIDYTGDWKSEIRRFLQETSPSLLQVVVSKDEEASPRVISKPDSTGRMVTSDLDDLWPPLEKAEFNKFISPWV